MDNNIRKPGNFMLISTMLWIILAISLNSKEFVLLQTLKIKIDEG